MRTNRPNHLKSFDYLGLHQYFLTFCTHQRHAAFNEAAIVALVHSQILRATTELGFSALAYCYMPDHAHLLIEGTEERSDCRQFIARAKQYSAFAYSRQTRLHLWQRYSCERTLRTEESAISVARYIAENPVRAGLVQRPEDYAFTGSSRYTMSELLEATQLAAGWSTRRAG